MLILNDRFLEEPESSCEWDPFAPEEMDEQDDFDDIQMIQGLERKQFEGTRLCGKNAHAYKKSLDNVEIYNLKSQGLSYREIAKLLDCSPSTVRNRFNRMMARS